MSADPHLLPSGARPQKRLVHVLQRERTAQGSVDTDQVAPVPSDTADEAALVERAKGALMLHFGIDSLQAFAVLVGWARLSGSSVSTIAHTLLSGICEGSPQTEVRQRALMRWLEAQLRTGDPGHAQLRAAPAGSGTGP